MAGKVFGQQTQYFFSPVPPSTESSPRIPATVCEGRGGESGFATNQQTQLQFSLRDVPNRSNLATDFSPRRVTPVVIEKVSAKDRQPSTMSQMITSDERMALATKLARLEARRQKREMDRMEAKRRESEARSGVGYRMDSDVEEYQSEDSNRRYYDHKEKREDSRIEDLEQHLKNCNLQSSTNNEPVTTKNNDPVVVTKPVPNTRASINPARLSINPSHLQRPSQDLQSAPMALFDEIDRLRKDLKKQRGKMADGRNLNEVQEPTSIYREPASWNEEDDTEERKQLRRDEQLIRNSRLMYDLSQQVHQLNAQVTKKVPKEMLVQKLTVAQRIAHQLLQGYNRITSCSSNSRSKADLSIPPELTTLINQLSNLAGRIGAGMRKAAELSITLDQLQSFLRLQKHLHEKDQPMRRRKSSLRCSTKKPRSHTITGGPLLGKVYHHLRRSSTKPCTHYQIPPRHYRSFSYTPTPRKSCGDCSQHSIHHPPTTPRASFAQPREPVPERRVSYRAPDSTIPSPTTSPNPNLYPRYSMAHSDSPNRESQACSIVCVNPHHQPPSSHRRLTQYESPVQKKRKSTSSIGSKRATPFKKKLRRKSSISLGRRSSRRRSTKGSFHGGCVSVGQTPCCWEHCYFRSGGKERLGSTSVQKPFTGQQSTEPRRSTVYEEPMAERRSTVYYGEEPLTGQHRSTGYGEPMAKQRLTGYGETLTERRLTEPNAERRRSTVYGENWRGQRSMSGDRGTARQSVTLLECQECQRSSTPEHRERQISPSCMKSRKSVGGPGENHTSMIRTRQSVVSQKDFPGGEGVFQYSSGNGVPTVGNENTPLRWCKETGSVSIPQSPLLEDPVQPTPSIERQVAELEKLRDNISSRLQELTGKTETTVPQNRNLHQPHRNHVNMMERLDQLEAEEEAIRHRWNTIAYEDSKAHGSEPPVTIHTSDVSPGYHPAPRTTYGASMGYEPGPSDEPSNGDKIVSSTTRAERVPWIEDVDSEYYYDDSLSFSSSETVTSVQCYRDQYARYLRSMAHSGHHPWEVAERVADDLLGEAVDDVADEVADLCEGCVEELYGNEFIGPP